MAALPAAALATDAAASQLVKQFRTPPKWGATYPDVESDGAAQRAASGHRTHPGAYWQVQRQPLTAEFGCCQCNALLRRGAPVACRIAPHAIFGDLVRGFGIARGHSPYTCL